MSRDKLRVTDGSPTSTFHDITGTKVLSKVGLDLGTALVPVPTTTPGAPYHASYNSTLITNSTTTVISLTTPASIRRDLYNLYVVCFSDVKILLRHNGVIVGACATGPGNPKDSSPFHVVLSTVTTDLITVDLIVPAYTPSGNSIHIFLQASDVSV